MTIGSGGWLQAAAGGVDLLVRVAPRAGATKIAGLRDGRLLVRLSAAPVEGEANNALIAFLADILDLPARRIVVASGEHSRNKRVRIDGADTQQVAAAISAVSVLPLEQS